MLSLLQHLRIMNSGRTFGLIFLTFLWISLIFTVVYSIINYFLLSELSAIRESIRNIFLPASLLILCYFVFYNTKLKAAPKLNNDLTRIYFIIIILAVPGPVAFQYVLRGVSIKVHQDVLLKNITLGPGVQQYYLNAPVHYDADSIAILPRYYTSYNKHAPDDSHYDVYVVSLVRSPGEQEPLFWYGKKYSRVDRKDDSPNDARGEVFESTVRSGIDKFKKRAESDSVTALELDKSDDEYQYYEAAKMQRDDGKYLTLPILTELKKRVSVTFITRFSIIAFAAGQIIWAIVCLFIRVNEWELEEDSELSFDEKLKKKKKDLLETFSWFIPKKGYFATPLIIDLNLLIFIILGFMGVSMMNPSGADLIPYGSNYAPAVYDGQVWRLLTSAFLHFGVIHIVMNMMALGIGGFVLETVLGTKRFLILYFISAIGCSIASYIWTHGNAAGASGAIFGLLGAMLFYSVFNIGRSENRGYFIVIFTFFGLITLIMDFVGWHSSDIAGHLGGMVTGMITAILFIPHVRAAKEIEM